ncbi:type II toxin-antitoxin system YoeB family toxin [Streptomyces sp. NPDC005329]|uniref:type II toxin-antitoxin system YoeB family toxin n=1 Tax=Streptomyces sp. NPDC005329 TaxID=3157034 RepID=UPI0033B6B032
MQAHRGADGRGGAAPQGVRALTRPCGASTRSSRTSPGTATRGSANRTRSIEHGFQGSWSRRVNDERLLIHEATDDGVLIAQCRYRYES